MQLWFILARGTMGNYFLLISLQSFGKFDERGVHLYSTHCTHLYLLPTDVPFLSREKISGGRSAISLVTLQQSLRVFELAPAWAYQPTLIPRTLQEYSTLQWHVVLSSTESAILLQIDETLSIRVQCFALVYSWLVLQIPCYFFVGANC